LQARRFSALGCRITAWRINAWRITARRYAVCASYPARARAASRAGGRSARISRAVSGCAEFDPRRVS